MATPQDKLNYKRLRAQGAAFPLVVPKLPALPPEVRKRFPSLTDYEAKQEKWRQEMAVAMGWQIPP